ncbi:hypothetical protein [Arthrobacter sp. ISL-65]|uniref:hypothetical protein n=1 Tax=Arthrobacter sp. ISL-65 TaxID=2819112 RepID=UPI00203635E3|nr:hypothetical protein [Arthrobacter sp. ISL-65]
MLAPGVDEAGQLSGAVDDVFDVEDSFGVPAEPAEHAVFLNPAAGGEDSGVRVQGAGQGGDVAFVAGGPVQHEQHGGILPSGGVEVRPGGDLEVGCGHVRGS